MRLSGNFLWAGDKGLYLRVGSSNGLQMPLGVKTSPVGSVLLSLWCKPSLAKDLLELSSDKANTSPVLSPE